MSVTLTEPTELFFFSFFLFLFLFLFLKGEEFDKFPVEKRKFKIDDVMGEIGDLYGAMETLGPLQAWWCKGEIGDPWWRDEKIGGLLLTWWGNFSINY